MVTGSRAHYQNKQDRKKTSRQSQKPRITEQIKPQEWEERLFQTCEFIYLIYALCLHNVTPVAHIEY